MHTHTLKKYTWYINSALRRRIKEKKIYIIIACLYVDKTLYLINYT